MWCFLLLTLFVAVQGRAVNISNTWVLPEEGFPVFYRYFRDRISWYEADAVCQFHHANLVTVDTTAQYDAVRAYLKELDISSAVWVGLIRSNPDGDFTWTDYRGLSGDGYWSAAPDTRSAPLCAAADPAADYRWESRACGGPSVASFICELPVPQWALGNEGCMVRALPAVTVLYLPESAAVQLTADCGLAGVRRVQCTGNMKRDELLKELACTEDDQTSLILNGTSPMTLWPITTDSAFTTQDTNNEVSTDEIVTTEHEDDINQSTSLKVISTSYSIIPDISDRISAKQVSTKKLFKIPLHKNIDLDIINNNNLQSNETPKQDRNEDFFINEQNEKLEDEKLLQHTKLHDELARLGNLETIFSQPTDHFVPPLVMAKAKISDDMTALSIEEKLAQQLSHHQFIKQNILSDKMVTDNNINKETYNIESLNSTLSTALPSTNISTSLNAKNNEQTGNMMHIMPKKYNNKYDDTKHKVMKNYLPKSFDLVETETTIPSKSNTKDNGMASTIKTITEHTHIDIYPTNSHSAEDDMLELTVIIKDAPINQSNNVNVITTNGPLYVNAIINQDNTRYNEKDLTPSQNFSSTTANEVTKEEVIDIHVFKNHSNYYDALLETTTRIPINNLSSEFNAENINNNTLLKKTMTVLPILNNNDTTTITVDSTTTSKHSMVENFSTTEGIFQAISGLSPNITGELDNDLNVNNTALNTNNAYNISENAMSPSNDSAKESFDSIIDSDFELEKNNTNASLEIDDFQSPLLSGASEPLHKPNRSRRPQQQNRNKFNPFRILG